ncbi:hypothetical protein VTJ83DRAFT_7580 [Remersonia thermophila]|uniref:MIT domain-containing protein n=1 Tax=Remersonia thermophila TaxID=72144 RepID=A0ABR4D425_9PEZI
MSSYRPAVAAPLPTSSFHPSTSTTATTTTPTTRTPPLPSNGLADVAGPYASPSRRIRNGSRDEGNLGARAHLFHSHHNHNHPPNQNHHPLAFLHHHNHRDEAGPLSRPSAPAVRHIAAFSAVPPNPPRSSSLNHANPPRTSSLLPPARIVINPGTPSDAAPPVPSPFNDPRPAPRVPESSREGNPRHGRGHSRSDSGGSLSDTLRNLNRWSVSTTSSRASSLAEFTRRVSAEILGYRSPSRRPRPSPGGSSPRSSPRRDDRQSPTSAPVPPLQSLPRISTGPSLAHEVLQLNLARFSPTPEESDREPVQDGASRQEPATRSQEAPQEFSHHPGALADSPDMMSITHESAAMSYTHNGHPGGHPRAPAGSSEGAASNRSSRDRSRDGDRRRQGRGSSQRGILARALETARTAVRLDNAGNPEGARRAYAEACAVLQQVLLRTSFEEDRRRLEDIHQTYLARVMELDEQLADMETQEKELPERPGSNDLHDMLAATVPTGPSRAATPGLGGHEALAAQIGPSRETARTPPPPSRASPLPTDPRETPTSYLTAQYSLQSAFSRARYPNNNGTLLRPPAADTTYMPPPLSPRRGLSPARMSPPPAAPESPRRAPPEVPSYSRPPTAQSTSHHRDNSHESISWLDPIDESDRASTSSVHSASSSRIRRRHLRGPSGATETEFDAALDDAIEAAYDDGYEPDESAYIAHGFRGTHTVPIVSSMHHAEMTREAAHDSEREALRLATEREQQLRLQQQLEDEEFRRHEAIGEDFFDGNDSDEEARAQAARDNALGEFSFGLDSRSAVPRESDSSGMTGHTWNSSSSNLPTSTMVLTPVSEDELSPRGTPGVNAFTGPLPEVPDASQLLPPHSDVSASQQPGNGVRNRRLSGQNAKELKIETARIAPAPGPATAGPTVPAQHIAGSYIVQQRQALSAGPVHAPGLPPARTGPSPVPGAREDQSLPPLPPNPEEHSRVGTPSVVRPNLRKNYSSSSLKSLRTRNLSISHAEETSDHSPATPFSTHFGSRLPPAVPSLPAGIKDRVISSSNGGGNTTGLHLFENHFHSPDRPGSPNPMTPDAPAPLEPCPTDTLLRPFWLMRCLYQTLCHPRGGYLSTKLFVPRDVWRIKGVKLKNVEDKIANCDLLTAALQRLARVDTCDADAVLEEMQALEAVLEQVQATLTKKLGNEVGVAGVGAMFKDAAAAAASGDGSDLAAMPRSGSVVGKGSGFSWRRLRSKNSSANLPGLSAAASGSSSRAGSAAGAASTTNVNEAGKDGSSGSSSYHPSLPMTEHPTRRPVKRDLPNVVFTGPNAGYMASLARLFDAAQMIDQIARQVEDPGLRHADKTQVGIELCTRHAAEFFAFYICRFVLADVTLLLDKFVKRGTEWVLS